MFAMILIGMISFTSCTSDLEQTKEVKQTINKKYMLSDLTCENQEQCAVQAIEEAVNEDVNSIKDLGQILTNTSSTSRIRCWVTNSQWTNGVMYGMGQCSDGSVFGFHYVDDVAYITFRPD